MLLGGDEFGRTQGGNNNAYCQDNEISWWDWTHGGIGRRAATSKRLSSQLIALRQEHTALRSRHFCTASASRLRAFSTSPGSKRGRRDDARDHHGTIRSIACSACAAPRAMPTATVSMLTFLLNPTGEDHAFQLPEPALPARHPDRHRAPDADRDRLNDNKVDVALAQRRAGLFQAGEAGAMSALGMASVVWRKSDRTGPDAISHLGAGAERSVASPSKARPPLPMARSGRRLVRGRSDLRRRRSLSLRAAGRHRCSRSGFARPGRRRPWRQHRRRSARRTAGGIRNGAAGPGTRRCFTNCTSALLGGFAGVARELAAARRARRHRGRADADRGISRRAQLGLRRRAAVRARAQLRHARRFAGADRRRARARPDDLPRRRLQSFRSGRELSRRSTRRRCSARTCHTPWGPAIDFRRREVRRFFTENALYWLIEYRFDGLRFDAVHAIAEADWLDEMAAEVRAHCRAGATSSSRSGKRRQRRRHLARDFDAQWNDDGHHVLHVLLTGEREGYYEDYADESGRAAGALPEGRFHLSG